MQSGSAGNLVCWCNKDTVVNGQLSSGCKAVLLMPWMCCVSALGGVLHPSLFRSYMCVDSVICSSFYLVLYINLLLNPVGSLC